MYSYIHRIKKQSKCSWYLIEDEECWNLYLEHSDFGTLAFIFGLPKEETTYKDAINIMLANIQIYHQAEKQDYLNHHNP